MENNVKFSQSTPNYTIGSDNYDSEFVMDKDGNFKHILDEKLPLKKRISRDNEKSEITK